MIPKTILKDIDLTKINFRYTGYDQIQFDREKQESKKMKKEILPKASP